LQELSRGTMVVASEVSTTTVTFRIEQVHTAEVEATPTALS